MARTQYFFYQALYFELDANISPVKNAQNCQNPLKFLQGGDGACYH